MLSVKVAGNTIGKEVVDAAVQEDAAEKGAGWIVVHTSSRLVSTICVSR